jgi:uncharacterized protein
MTKQLWINLPVKNVKKSREFFTQLGFSFTQHGNTDHSLGVQIGANKDVVMLFEEPTFKNYSNNQIADTSKGSEVLISIDAESRREVDEIAARAKKAGGKIFGEPGDHEGWMYGCGFTDLDGHRWNALYMDMSKMPK